MCAFYWRMFAGTNQISIPAGLIIGQVTLVGIRTVLPLIARIGLQSRIYLLQLQVLTAFMIAILNLTAFLQIR